MRASAPQFRVWCSIEATGLSLLGVVLVDTVTRLNALKQCTSLVVNVCAAVFFLFSGDVIWWAAAVMCVGALAGGFSGGRIAHRVSARTQQRVDKMFAAAAGGTDQVACLWAHLPEAPFLSDIARVDLYAHVSTTNYPGVQFRYCTAIEAMDRFVYSSGWSRRRMAASSRE